MLRFGVASGRENDRVARQVDTLPWQRFRVKFAFSTSQPAWETTRTLMMLAIVRTSRKFSASGKSTGKNDVLKKQILVLSIMTNSNDNLRSGCPVQLPARASL